MAARFGTSILCDRVYIDQLTRKAVIAGMYGGDIRMGAIPGALDVSFYTEIWAVEKGDHSVSLEILLNGKDIGGMKAMVTVEDSTGPAMLASPGFQIAITSEGQIEFRGKIDDGEAQTLLVKAITINPAGSIFSSPPSSQSQTVSEAKDS